MRTRRQLGPSSIWWLYFSQKSSGNWTNWGKTDYSINVLTTRDGGKVEYTPEEIKLVLDAKKESLENIKKLKSFEKQIKEKQDEIKIKKNVISDMEFEKEVSNLNKKILDFNNQKKTMVEELTSIKNKELNLFFENI